MSDIKDRIVYEAARIVSGVRRGQYAPPERNFERIAILWNAYFAAKGLVLIPVALDEIHPLREHFRELLAQDVSPMMRLMKEARIIESPKHYDSHVDLVGYTLNGAEVNGVEVPAPPAPPPAYHQPETAEVWLKAGIVEAQKRVQELEKELEAKDNHTMFLQKQIDSLVSQFPTPPRTTVEDQAAPAQTSSSDDPVMQWRAFHRPSAD